MKIDRQLRDRHPQQPWRWDPHWEAGAIRSNSYAETLALSLFTAVWNAISIALAVVLVPRFAKTGEYEVLLVLLFPAVGLLLLLGTWRKWRRHRLFGQARFKPERLPGVVGGRLAGRFVFANLVPMTTEPVEATLFCTRLQRSGGRNNSGISRRVLWQGRNQAALESVVPGGASLAVDFAIPYHCEPTEMSNRLPRVEWTLRLDGKVNGRRLALAFAVPVFKTEDSDPAVDEQAVASEEVKRGNVDLKRAGFTVQSNARGDLRIEVPPAFRRHPGSAAVALLMVVGITVGLGLAIAYGAPLPVVILAAVFDLIAAAVAWSMLGPGSLTLVTDHDLRVLSKMGPLRRLRTAPADQLAAVDLRQAMSAQSGDGPPVVYYDLVARPPRQRPLVIVRASTNKLELEYLASLIRTRLGLEAPTEPVPEPAPEE